MNIVIKNDHLQSKIVPQTQIYKVYKYIQYTSLMPFSVGHCKFVFFVWGPIYTLQKIYIIV